MREVTEDEFKAFLAQHPHKHMEIITGEATYDATDGPVIGTIAIKSRGSFYVSTLYDQLKAPRGRR